MSHTKTPWQVSRAYADNGGKYISIDHDFKDDVVNEYGVVDWEDAAFIVKAVNSHEMLVEALELLCHNINDEDDGGVKVARQALAQLEE